MPPLSFLTRARLWEPRRLTQVLSTWDRSGIAPPGTNGTSYLFAQWADGKVTDARIIGPDEPLAADYVLGMDYQDWKALHDGYDAQRTVMYRKMLLEEGDLLEFFKGIYFFVESVAVIGTVPARYP